MDRIASAIAVLVKSMVTEWQISPPSSGVCDLGSICTPEESDVLGSC
jgi:hypothetical protein